MWLALNGNKQTCLFHGKSTAESIQPAVNRAAPICFVLAKREQKADWNAVAQHYQYVPCFLICLKRQCKKGAT